MKALLLALAALASAAALFLVRPHATPGPPMRDFEAYYAAGASWNAGENPYGTAIWKAENRLQGVNPRVYAPLPFVSPPATLPLWSLFARLPFPAANAVWRGVLVLCALGLALCALQAAGVRFSPSAMLAIAVAALGFGPLTSAVALGQLALPACAFAALSLLYEPAGILAWFQPNLAFAMLSQTVRMRGAAWFAGGAALFAAACAVVAGFDGAARYVALLHSHGRAEAYSAIQLTAGAITYGFGAGGAAASFLQAAAAVAAALFWLLRVRTLQDATLRFCATSALLAAAMPFFHEHDLTIAFLPAVVLCARCERRFWHAACAAALLCATDWLGLAQRPDGALQTLLLVGSAGAALIALRRDADLRMTIVPACALAVIAAASVLARLHPAPVWPDAMHALHGGGTIEQIWRREQAATGLYARNAVWALLRCGSLLGCWMLAVTAAVSSRSTADSRNPLPVPA